MKGLMQGFPLTIQHVLWRLERLYHKQEIVSQTDEGIVRRSTYGEIVPRIHRLASALEHLGVRKGDRVGTLAWTNQRHLELFYAIPCMGAVAHTMNPRLLPEQLEFIINDGGDRLIFVDRGLLPVLDKLAGKIPRVERIVVLSDGQALPEHRLGELLDYETLLAAEPARFGWPNLDENDAASMCHTSGTTGHPKGVVYSHRSQFLHTLASVTTSGFGLAQGDTVLPATSIYHANALGLPYSAGMVGFKLVLPHRFLGDVKVLGDLLRTERTTVMAAVVTIMSSVLHHMRETGARFPSLRFVITGSSAVPRTLIDGLGELGIRVGQGWGSTEMSPIATFTWPRSWHREDEETEIRLTGGAPVPGAEVRVVDDAGDELPWDGVAVGEAQTRGPFICSAYYKSNDPERFTKDGWFRSGDLATISPDGFVKIVDRIKDVIKSGGEWISSVDLENMILAHPKVLEAAVIGLRHPRWSERPVAYVVERPEVEGTLRAEEVLAFLRDKVSKWWLPDEVRIVAEIPKTTVGKYDKKVLRAGAEPLKSVGAQRP